MPALVSGAAARLLMLGRLPVLIGSLHIDLEPLFSLFQLLAICVFLAAELLLLLLLILLLQLLQIILIRHLATRRALILRVASSRICSILRHVCT